MVSSINNKLIIKDQKNMAKVNSLINNLLKNLDDRKRDVLVKRFGLGTKKAMTLQAVGDEYGVTRERIRQIESLALSDVRLAMKGNKEAEAVLNLVNKKISEMGGVAKQENLVLAAQKELGAEANLANLSFLREASKSFGFQPETDNFYPFWFNDDKSVKKSKLLIEKVSSSLKDKRGEVLVKGAFESIFDKEIKTNGLNKDVGLNYLAVSKNFSTSPYGDFGLSEWPEVNPATIRDWSYIVLKKENKPLHFEEIAKKISQIHTKKNKVFTPTVHNELIKDSRFVLVGRGVYGLTEFGYEAGGIKEVIKKILSKNSGLKAGEIVELVNRQRIFKKNTIILHLQDRKIFKRDADGRFFTNEA